MDNNKFNFFNHYAFLNQENVVITYTGPVTETVLAEISRDIQRKFGNNMKIGRKLFSIFIEMAQNILYYSCEVNHVGAHNERVGTIVVTETEEFYFVTAGNLVKKEQIEVAQSVPKG